MRRLITSIIAFSFSTSSFARYLPSEYIVKKGDTLSEIVSRFTSAPPALYGSSGRIAKILKLNPKITDPNLIYVGQVILLRPKKIALKKSKPYRLNISVAEKKLPSSWVLGANYGALFYRDEQSGIIGDATVSATALNSLGVYSRFNIGKYHFKFAFSNYKLEYRSSTTLSSLNLTALKLLAGVKNYRAGIMMSSTPLFKNSAGIIEEAKESSIDLLLGYSVWWQLPTKKESNLEISGELAIPISSSSDNSTLEIDSLSGWQLCLQALLNRKIKQFADYSIYLTMPIAISYRSYKSQIIWSTSQGEVTSKYLTLSGGLGVEIKF